jgi:tyrosyl-tRNA synthetase
MKAMVASERLHPKKAKEGLALRIVADYHGEPAAREAREEFERVHGGQGLPDEIPEHHFPAEDGKVQLPALLTAIGLVSSRGEASRLLRQGAVRIDDERPPEGEREIAVVVGQSRLIRVGKRRFARVTFD